MMTLKTVILECRDVRRLLAFYQGLLGWPVAFDEGEFIRIECPDTGMASPSSSTRTMRRPSGPRRAASSK